MVEVSGVIKLKINDKTLELTVDEAKDVLQSLKVLFEEKQPWQPWIGPYPSQPMPLKKWPDDFTWPEPIISYSNTYTAAEQHGSNHEAQNQS